MFLGLSLTLRPWDFRRKKILTPTLSIAVKCRYFPRYCPRNRRRRNLIFPKKTKWWGHCFFLLHKNKDEIPVKAAKWRDFNNKKFQIYSLGYTLDQLSDRLSVPYKIHRKTGIWVATWNWNKNGQWQQKAKVVPHSAGFVQKATDDQRQWLPFFFIRRRKFRGCSIATGAKSGSQDRTESMKLETKVKANEWIEWATQATVSVVMTVEDWASRIDSTVVQWSILTFLTASIDGPIDWWPSRQLPPRRPFKTHTHTHETRVAERE